MAKAKTTQTELDIEVSNEKIKAKTVKQLQNVIAALKKVGIPASFRTVPVSGDSQIELQLDSARHKAELIARFHEVGESLSGKTPKVEPLTTEDIRVVSSDNKFRQVIIRLEGAARTVVRDVTEGVDSVDHKPKRNSLTRKFPVTLPVGTSYNVKLLKTVPNVPGTYYKHTQHYRVTASVPAATTYFLVGYDERHLFISMLPKPVKTVQQAHRALLPKELQNKKKGSYFRQGEFFFIPVTKAEIEIIIKENKEGGNANADGARGLTGSDPDVAEGDHFASVTVVHKNIEYVSGCVSNDRHTLFLNGWYRCIHNMEIISGNDSWD